MDGDYGVQTHAALVNACKNYSAKDIQTNIKHAAVSSVIFDTKNKKKFDTERQVERAYNNFNDHTIVLKGGISNIRYIWQTEGADPCETCAALDGTEFDTIDDIPDRPHPNCLCNVYVKDDENEKNEDEEECDCIERLDELIAELEGIAGDVENLSGEMEAEINDIEVMASNIKTIITEADENLSALESEYGQHLPECPYNIDSIYNEISAGKEKNQNLLQDILYILNYARTGLQVIYAFVSNYMALLHEAYVLKEAMDKYRHSVANCQSAQLGELGEQMATTLSDKKELYDQYTYVKTHRVTIEEAIADSEKDQIANRLGRERGREYPTCDCRILMQDLKPPNKPEYTPIEHIEKIIEFILKKF